MIDIDALEKHCSCNVETLQHGAGIFTQDKLQYSQIILELIHRLRESERNAERYKWLRHGDNDELILRDYEPSLNIEDFPMSYMLRNEELNEAIDIAIAQQREKENE